MISKIFGAITRFGKKHKFQNNVILKNLIPIYHGFQRMTVSRVDAVAGENTLGDALRNDFLAKNPKRVEAVAAMLADEKSKETYLGMIKFRQSGLKKDFPFSCYDKDQYFIKELPLVKGEVFVDCGSFTGDTIDVFIKRCPEYKRIIAFEPDPDNFRTLNKKHGGDARNTLINAGVYDKEGELRFDARGNGGSTVKEMDFGTPEIVTIKVQSIDALKLEDVTLIKMDVEGAEMNALRGAEETIIKYKPRLAICIYHSNEDMVQIAEYIRELVPKYKLYVGQHALFPCAAETVLYAIMP